MKKLKATFLIVMLLFSTTVLPTAKSTVTAAMPVWNLYSAYHDTYITYNPSSNTVLNAVYQGIFTSDFNNASNGSYDAVNHRVLLTDVGALIGGSYVSISGYYEFY